MLVHRRVTRRVTPALIWLSIGQEYGPLIFKVGFVAKLFCDLSPNVLDFYSKYKFKTFFYSTLCI